MNAKTMKKIYRQAEKISVEWLKSLLPEEEGSKINLKNYKDYMQMTSHYFSERQFYMSAFTEKWTRKKLKKLYVKDPLRPIDTYTFTDLQ